MTALWFWKKPFRMNWSVKKRKCPKLTLRIQKNNWKIIIMIKLFRLWLTLSNIKNAIIFKRLSRRIKIMTRIAKISENNSSNRYIYWEIWNSSNPHNCQIYIWKRNTFQKNRNIMVKFYYVALLVIIICWICLIKVLFRFNDFFFHFSMIVSWFVSWK